LKIENVLPLENGYRFFRCCRPCEDRGPACLSKDWIPVRVGNDRWARDDSGMDKVPRQARDDSGVDSRSGRE